MATMISRTTFESGGPRWPDTRRGWLGLIDWVPAHLPEEALAVHRRAWRRAATSQSSNLPSASATSIGGRARP